MKQRKRLISIIITFVMIVGMWAPIEGKAATTDLFNIHVSGTRDYSFAKEVVDLVNQERAKEGLASLTADVDLLEAAMLRSGEISVYFEHYRPNGSICFTACGKMNGENIAVGMDTPEEVVEEWMNSPGHRENILDKKFQSIGVGCFWNGKVCYWVQCFGCKKAEGTDEIKTSGTQEIKQEISVKRANLDIYAYPVKNSLNSNYMLTGESGYFRYGWNNPIGYFYATGVQEDFQFTSDDPSVVAIKEDGTFVAQSEGSTTLRVALKEDPTIEWTTQIEARQPDLSNEQYAFVNNVYDTYTYTGSEIKPIPKVYYEQYDSVKGMVSNVLLEEGKDYTLTYEDNLKVGTARITIEGMGKYKGSRTIEFTIQKARVENFKAVSYTGVYDGKAHGIVLSGMEDGSTVEYSTDDVTWQNTPPTRTEVGETIVYYQITNPNYETITGARKILITAKKITECTFSEIGDVSYNGTAITPDVIIKDGETILEKDVDYKLEYKNNTEAGEAQIKVTGINQYTGTQTVKFSIIRDISSLEYPSITEKAYTGYEIKPTITIKDGIKILSQQTDYTIVFSNNIEPGKATAIVTGKGYYSGTKVLEFDIKKNVSMLTVTSGTKNQEYTGKQICPKVTICDNLYELQEGIDYTVTYGENISVGMGLVYIEGTGYYKGERVITFNIVRDTSGTKTKTPNNTNTPTETNQPSNVVTKVPTETDQPSNVVTKTPTETNQPSNVVTKTPTETNQPSNNVTKTPTETNQPSNNVTKEPAETNQPSSNVTKTPTKTNQPSNDVVVTSKPTATKAPAKTNNTTQSVPTVAKVKNLKASKKKKSIVIQWKKLTKINGYQIQISTNAQYKKASKITVGKTKTKYTYKKAKTGVKYYIRIRAYKNYTTKAGVTKKAVGKWTAIKVKK